MAQYIPEGDKNALKHAGLLEADSLDEDFITLTPYNVEERIFKITFENNVDEQGIRDIIETAQRNLNEQRECTLNIWGNIVNGDNNSKSYVYVKLD